MNVKHQDIKMFMKFARSEKDRIYDLWRSTGMDTSMSYSDFMIDYLLGEKFQLYCRLLKKGKKKCSTQSS